MNFGNCDHCLKFAALGRVAPGEPHLFQMRFSWRGTAEFNCSQEAGIEPLLDQL